MNRLMTFAALTMCILNIYRKVTERNRIVMRTLVPSWRCNVARLLQKDKVSCIYTNIAFCAYDKNGVWKQFITQQHVYAPIKIFDKYSSWVYIPLPVEIGHRSSESLGVYVAHVQLINVYHKTLSTLTPKDPKIIANEMGISYKRFCAGMHEIRATIYRWMYQHGYIPKDVVE